jgi:hypothetical protein
MKCRTINCGHEAVCQSRHGFMVCARCYEETDLALPRRPSLWTRFKAWRKEYKAEARRTGVIDVRKMTDAEADQLWEEIKAEERRRHSRGNE